MSYRSALSVEAQHPSANQSSLRTYDEVISDYYKHRMSLDRKQNAYSPNARIPSNAQDVLTLIHQGLMNYWPQFGFLNTSSYTSFNKWASENFNFRQVVENDYASNAENYHVE